MYDNVNVLNAAKLNALKWLKWFKFKHKFYVMYITQFLEKYIFKFRFRICLLETFKHTDACGLHTHLTTTPPHTQDSDVIDLGCFQGIGSFEGSQEVLKYNQS